MRGGIVTLLVGALFIAPGAHAQTEPVSERGDQFAAKEAGTVEKLRFWYGPYAVPPGNDYNRFDLNLPVRNGYVLSIEPGLHRVHDLSIPTHQEAHIHHAHWLRLDPGNGHDNYTSGFTQWLWGTGDEETRADARRQTKADPKGPVYGGQTGPGEIEPVIYMIHNKTAEPLNTWMVLDVVFLHGSEAELEKKTGRDHRSPTGVIFGRTFDVLRNAAGDGTFDTATDDKEGPIEWVSTLEGTIVGAGGHLHPGGYSVTLENLGSEARPCPRTKGNFYGGTALFRSEQVNRHAPLSEDYQMTITRPAWRAPIRKGDRLRINGKYENKRYAWYAAMAHVGLFVDQEQKPRKGCAPYPVRKQKKKIDLLTGTLNRPWDKFHVMNACGKQWHRPCERKEPDRGDGMETNLVTIQGFRYSPGDRGLSGQMGAPPRIRQGTSLTFMNADQQLAIRHSVTTCRWPCNGPYVTNYPLADGVWDSGTLGFDLVDGGSPMPDARTPADLKAGKYSYFCRIHPWMRGAFEVVK